MNEALVPLEEIVEYVSVKNFTNEITHAEVTQIVFPNGYIASIIHGGIPFYGAMGFREVAILDDNYELCYDTPLTTNVEVFDTIEETVEFVNKIAALPVKE